ncbi:MAG: shikimate kinase [Verrucomicrobia bacterium]|nr:shikimate kinase [Verrucomicrobiota bacterium]
MTGKLRNIALIGFMGVGKSSVGRMAAAALGYDFVDTDELIEQRAGAKVPEIFQHQGEPAFREMERAILRELAGWSRKVVATGGGLAAQPGNLDELKRHALVVCLWAAPETVWERVRHQTHRPLLNVPDPVARIRELLAEREPFYKQADLLLTTDQRSSKQLAQLVVAEYRRLQGGHASS